jgi:predicted nuclease of predicted toxin-antitoxin system
LGWTNGFAVITTDSDFLAFSQRLGWPPKIIHIERCDFTLRVIEDQLRRRGATEIH